MLIITGDTGSGKTTQVAQYILEDAAEAGEYTSLSPQHYFCKAILNQIAWNLGQSVGLAVTEPRRLAAVTVAERVAAERGEKVAWMVFLLFNISESG